MKLYNTLGHKLEEFKPLSDRKVKLYTCGPTVYDYQHIGNYSGYIYWDVLVRLLKHKKYEVKRVMNITDVGHLVSDADEGEDKLEKGARREGKSPREIAYFYTADFLEAMDKLGLVKPDIYAKATDYIEQQLEIIELLLDRGYAYQTEQAIYFDVSKLSSYGELTGQKLSDKEEGAREEVVVDKNKHHPQDFALWFFAVGRFEDHEMRWPSPWGEGFPGWHLECSAIIHATLGDPIDIHTGGVDHIGTHHTNEIAQTEAAYGHKLANYWLHNNHLMVDGSKISKSLGNGFTLEDLVKRDFMPTDFKLLVLQSHYRSESNFSWENLASAKNRLLGYQSMASLRFQLDSVSGSDIDFDEYRNKILAALEDDLETPRALAILSELENKLSSNPPTKKSELDFNEFLTFLDNILGLDLLNSKDISDEQKKLVEDREEARKSQNWAKADEIRKLLKHQQIEIKDTPQGAIWRRSER